MSQREQSRPPEPRPRDHGHDPDGSEPDPLLGQASAFGQAASDAINAALSGDSEAFNEQARQTGGQ